MGFKIFLQQIFGSILFSSSIESWISMVDLIRDETNTFFDIFIGITFIRSGDPGSIYHLLANINNIQPYTCADPCQYGCPVCGSLYHVDRYQFSLEYNSQNLPL
jgi:hypothetical protein